MLAFITLVLVVAAFSGGHDNLSKTIDGLDLPDQLVEVAKVRYGPETCFAGDCPHVDRYYASPVGPDETCVIMEEWANDQDLDRRGPGEPVRCDFAGSINSDFITILVVPPLSEAPAAGLSLEPIPIELGHEAIVIVGAS